MSGHPPWCIAPYCTANRNQSGAHRSASVTSEDGVVINLYAPVDRPGSVCIELRLGAMPVAILPARTAGDLGRILRDLGWVATDVGA